MFKAKEIEDFLNKDDCQYLIDNFKDIDIWTSGGTDFWSNRVINMQQIINFDEKTGNIVISVRNRIAEKLKEVYNLENVYSDLFQMVRWFPGMEQPPHADDMTNIDSPDLEWFRHREYAAIVYLNDNYSGGQTYYPNYDYYISPKVGKLALHPGDPEHLHGVTKIENEIRYTLASFWTTDRNFADEWSIH